jgi:hypothetical protein
VQLPPNLLHVHLVLLPNGKLEDLTGSIKNVLFLIQKKMNVDYKIEAPTTLKNKIKHPPLSEQGVIPKLGTTSLIIGKSGSGKTVLLYNLLKNNEFYGKSFDKMFLFSATAEIDDILDQLHIPDAHKFSDLDEAIDALHMIHKHQREQIEEHGNHKAKQFCMIYDDILGHTRFINSTGFLQSATASRHYNETSFILTQHLRKIPKAIRLQGAAFYVFACSAAECETLCDEFCPPFMNRKQFMRMLQDVWQKPHDFLTINLRVPIEERYRKGIAQVIDLKKYMSTVNQNEFNRTSTSLRGAVGSEQKQRETTPFKTGGT